MATGGPGDADRPGGRMRVRRAGPRRAVQLPTRDDLEDALEIAAVEAMEGGLADAGTVGRVKTAVRAVLLRRGLDAARVDVGLQGTGLHVRVLLPPDGARVRQIVLTLG